MLQYIALPIKLQDPALKIHTAFAEKGTILTKNNIYKKGTLNKKELS